MCVTLLFFSQYNSRYPKAGSQELVISEATHSL